MVKYPGRMDAARYQATLVKAAELASNPPKVITASQIEAAFKDQTAGSLPGDALLAEMVERTMVVLSDKGLCPTCGQKIRTAMSNAERQRRYRERKRAKL